MKMSGGNAARAASPAGTMARMDPHETFSSSGFNAPTPRTPARLLVIAPILLLLASFGTSAYLLYRAIFGSEAQSKQLLAPGIVEFTMEEPGKLAILLETRTSYEGQTYFASGIPAGTAITVVEKASGDVIPVSLGGSYSESVGNTSRTGVGSCRIERPGTYVVTITGPTTPHVFLVRRSLLETLGVAIAISIAIALVGLVISVKWLGVFSRQFAAARAAKMSAIVHERDDASRHL